MVSASTRAIPQPWYRTYRALDYPAQDTTTQRISVSTYLNIASFMKLKANVRREEGSQPLRSLWERNQKVNLRIAQFTQFHSFHNYK